MAGKVILIKASGEIEEAEANSCPSLEDLQGKVGGYIERVSVLYQGQRATMVVDEEGLLKSKPWNRAATEIYHTAVVNGGTKPDYSGHVDPRFLPHSPIVGDAVLLVGRSVQLR